MLQNREEFCIMNCYVRDPLYNPLVGWNSKLVLWLKYAGKNALYTVSQIMPFTSTHTYVF